MSAKPMDSHRQQSYSEESPPSYSHHYHPHSHEEDTTSSSGNRDSTNWSYHHTYPMALRRSQMSSQAASLADQSNSILGYSTHPSPNCLPHHEFHGADFGIMQINLPREQDTQQNEQDNVAQGQGNEGPTEQDSIAEGDGNDDPNEQVPLFLDAQGNVPRAPGNIHKPNWEADIPFNLHMHRLDPKVDGPDNLVAHLHNLSMNRSRYRPEKYAQQAYCHIKNAHALEWMTNKDIKTSSWGYNKHFSDGGNKTPAVHAVYLDHPKDAHTVTVFYNRQDEELIDSDLYCEQRRREMLKGRNRSSFFSSQAPSSSTPQVAPAGGHVIAWNPIPEGYDLPPPTSRHRRRRRANLERLDPDLQKELLQRDFEHFINIHDEYVNEYLPRLHRLPNGQFRLTKSLDNQQDTRVYTDERMAEEAPDGIGRDMRDHNDERRREGITKTIYDSESSDDEFQLRSPLPPQIHHVNNQLFLPNRQYRQ